MEVQVLEEEGEKSTAAIGIRLGTLFELREYTKGSETIEETLPSEPMFAPKKLPQGIHFSSVEVRRDFVAGVRVSHARGQAGEKTQQPGLHPGAREGFGTLQGVTRGGACRLPRFQLIQVHASRQLLHGLAEGVIIVRHFLPQHRHLLVQLYL